MGCFSDDLKEKMAAEGIVVEDYARYLDENFQLLTAEEQASYSVKSEAARIKAWDQYDKERRERLGTKASS